MVVVLRVRIEVKPDVAVRSCTDVPTLFCILYVSTRSQLDSVYLPNIRFGVVIALECQSRTSLSSGQKVSFLSLFDYLSIVGE